MDSILNTYFLVLLTTVIFLLYIFHKINGNYWKKRGVPYLKPDFLFGNAKDIIVNKAPITLHENRIYRELAPYKFGGFFTSFKPILLIRDPILIKRVLVKDFHHFYDRNSQFVDERETLTHHLFNLTGERWKKLRTKLTPTFTSSKMKMMFGVVKECSEQLKITLEKTRMEENDFDMKDLLARYTTDVISSCAFGLQANSLVNPDAEFREVGKRLLKPRFLGDLLSIISPKLQKWLRIPIIDKECSSFFKNLVRDMVKYREENDINRQDFLSLLIDMKNQDMKLKQAKQENGIEQTADNCPDEDIMTMELLAAQCFVFFVAGFETTSSASSFSLLELCKNPAIQQKLINEIDESLEKTNGEIIYEVLQQMPYLDKVIKETLRLYPAVPILFRECTEEYRIPDTDVIIEKGSSIFIPVYGIHHDEQYYSNPDQFDPEHFSEENKNSRPDFTYFPFGEGPRICIGLRFTYMQMKLALVTLLRNYTFRLSPKMKLPIELEPMSLLPMCKGGIWLNCNKRTDFCTTSS